MDAQQVTPSPSLFCPMKHLLDTYLQQARHHLIQREWWASWAGIIAGCTILAVGFVVFINPFYSRLPYRFAILATPSWYLYNHSGRLTAKRGIHNIDSP